MCNVNSCWNNPTIHWISNGIGRANTITNDIEMPKSSKNEEKK